ncbi:MAG TPA: methylmalonyl-CoA epimerase [Nakamurella sp.]|jgi:methylmalonyl-CoA/ethylmalonyl-CoA epimerase
MPVQPSAIDHVGIAVPDLEAAIAFYTDTLGGRLAHRETNEAQGVKEAMIAFGDGPGRAQVQLLAPLGPDSTIAKFLDRNGPGLQQLALRVDDVRAAAEAARAAGVRTLYDEPRRGTAGSSINFLHPKDAGGVLVELVELVEPTAVPNHVHDAPGVASAESARPSGTMVR